jgi:hypothetical protein
VATPSGSWAGKAGLLLGLVLALAACSTPVPSPTVAGGTPSTTPGSSHEPTPTPIPATLPEVVPLTLQWKAIDSRWTTPLLAVASTGREVIWSAGPQGSGDSAPDLYRFSPASGQTDLLVKSASRTANLLPIAGSPSGYAYVEQRDVAASGLVTWTLWYLRHSDQKPQQIDAMDPVGGQVSPAPSIAMSDGWLVWTSIHVRNAVVTSELRALNLHSGEIRLVASSPTTEGEFWFPDLDSDDLVYGVYQVTDGVPSGRVFETSLVDGVAPRRLDTDGAAAMPVVSGDTVIWKENPDNPFSWGTLVRYSKVTGSTGPIRLGEEPQVNYPTLGDRYLAAWQWDPTRFYLCDVETGRTLLVADYGRTSTEVDQRPQITGRLMAWSHATPLDTLELRWAYLPE